MLDIFSRVIPVGEASHVDRPLLAVPRICDKENERNAQGIAVMCVCRYWEEIRSLSFESRRRMEVAIWGQNDLAMH